MRSHRLYARYVLSPWYTSIFLIVCSIRVVDRPIPYLSSESANVLTMSSCLIVLWTECPVHMGVLTPTLFTTSLTHFFRHFPPFTLALGFSYSHITSSCDFKAANASSHFISNDDIF